MELAKTKVETAVREYIRLFPEEWAAFKKSVSVKIGKQENEWAELKGDHVLERHLFDMPETLFYAIQNTLTSDELDWLYARGDYEKGGKLSGLRWFMTQFPEFCITKTY